MVFCTYVILSTDTCAQITSYLDSFPCFPGFFPCLNCRMTQDLQWWIYASWEFLCLYHGNSARLIKSSVAQWSSTKLPIMGMNLYLYLLRILNLIIFPDINRTCANSTCHSFIAFCITRKIQKNNRCLL